MQCFGRTLLESTALCHIAKNEHSSLDRSRFVPYRSPTHVEDHLALVRCLHEHIGSLRAGEDLACEQTRERTPLLREQFPLLIPLYRREQQFLPQTRLIVGWQVAQSKEAASRCIGVEHLPLPGI